MHNDEQIGLDHVHVLSVMGRVHIAMSEQWSDINSFRHNFADISVCVHIEQSCVGSKSNIRAETFCRHSPRDGMTNGHVMSGHAPS